MRIFLTGFMGSGKSYTARKLATLLGFPFLDLDDWLEEVTDQSIENLFASYGETGFRQLEKNTLQDLDKLPNVVVAAGGGTPCFEDNMKWMKQNGITIYLRTSPEVLYDRLRGEMEHRPLLKGKTPEQLKAYIVQKLAERAPCYEQAHLIVEQSEVNLDLATLIYYQLPEITGH